MNNISKFQMDFYFIKIFKKKPYILIAIVNIQMKW